MREMSIDCNNELYSKFLTNHNTFSTCFNNSAIHRTIEETILDLFSRVQLGNLEV